MTTRGRETWILNAAFFIPRIAKRRAVRGECPDRRRSNRGDHDKQRPERSGNVVAETPICRDSPCCPGFVQAHVHLCQTLFRNQADDLELLDWLSKRIWVMEAAHTEKTLHTSASLGIHELLSSGTTCILDMGTVRHTEAILDAVRTSGIRASVGKCLMDHPKTTPESLRLEPTRDALAEASAIYDQWHGRENDRIRVSYAPRFVISCTESLLTEVARLARRAKSADRSHARERESQRDPDGQKARPLRKRRVPRSAGPDLARRSCSPTASGSSPTKKTFWNAFRHPCRPLPELQSETGFGDFAHVPERPAPARAESMSRSARTALPATTTSICSAKCAWPR